MTGERVVPYGVLAFAVVAPLVLGTVIARGPDTHGHLWQTLPPDYSRTPLDAVQETDLDQVLADLPPFAFPAAVRAETAPKLADRGTGITGTIGMPGMPGMGDAMAASAAAREAGGEEVQKVALVEREYGVSPDRLTVTAGVPVELAVTNEGKQVHGLWLAEFGIAQDIRSGKTQVFKFTPDRPGRYRYTCSYNLCGTDEEHARMVGFLTVR